MSLKILLAHSGITLTADPCPSTLDELRSWISKKTGTEAAHQILMTARGKQVKIQTLSVEPEVFLYDRRIFSSSSSLSTLLSKTSPPTPFNPQGFPNISNATGLQQWHNLFKRRRAWALELAEGSRGTAESIHRLDHEISIVRQGAAIAVENIKQHVGNLGPKYEQSKAWANQLLEDQAYLLRNWERALDLLASIDVYEELGNCIQGVRPVSRKLPTQRPTQAALIDYVVGGEVKEAARSGEDISRRFEQRVDDLKKTFEDTVAESSKIIEDFQQGMTLSDSDAGDQASKLMEEIEVLARKINADYEHVLGLIDTPKSIAQVSKTAQLHKTNFLPSLKETNEEVNNLLARTIERKEKTLKSSVQHLQNISAVESDVSSVHHKLASLDSESEHAQAFDLLNLVIRLPSIYGSLLVECVRRQEWSAKMTADSSYLVEEMASHKEEEAKRRKRWVKDVGGVVDLATLDDMALGIQVNVQAQKQRWPKVSREDVIQYLRHLKELGDLDGALNELENLVKTLDTPSKQQARRAKAFKNGSVHEAAYGRTSLLLRGDDEMVLAMRTEKLRMEDKLKTAESRVRKLEELLHRQSQFGQPPRPSSSAGFPSTNVPTFERYTTSPVTNFTSALSKARETGSRRSSVSSRRISIHNESDDKGLAQRIVSLEAELIAEKAHSAKREKEATAKTNVEDMLKSQIREAISTKEDLLGNFEAQQQEFDHERRLLEDDNSKLKLKLDELEDEFDRAMESRENVDKLHALEEEVERVKNDAASEMQKAHSQTESLRNEHATQQNKTKQLEREIQEHGEERIKLNANAHELTTQLRNRDQMQVDQHRALRSALLHLSRDETASEDFGALIETIEIVAEKSAAHLQNIKDALETARADNSSLEVRVSSQRDEIHDLRERLGSEERAVFSLREEFSSQKTQCETLQSQLEFERGEHDSLRTKFVEGATDSDALRAKLAGGERAIVDLKAEVTDLKALSKERKELLKKKEVDMETLQAQYDKLSALRIAQASQATEISAKLYSQNYTLERLLEQIGLTVTKKDGTMVVQKAQRAASASTTLNDPSMSMKRSLSGPMPTKSDFSDPADLEILHWADSTEQDVTERQFSDLMKEIASFDTDVFTEAVSKRVKEIEHIARKWQKETRAYRDKSHRFQNEAHDRIALRNFKEGDLALFLPTRDQATKPWAAFNVGAPHCFLREQDSHNLGKRDWLIARISKVEERVVDLSRSMNGLKGSGDQRSVGDKSEAGAFPNDENPYELSDGLRWYLIDAAEERPGAPINVGSGKVTVASANVDARGSIRMKKSSDGNEATKTLTRSLDSRRSSTNSKKGLAPVTSNATATSTGLDGMIEQSIDNAAAEAASSNLQTVRNVEELQDIDRPQSSRTLDVPAQTGQSGQSMDQIRSLAISPSKSLKERAIVRSSPQKPSPEKRKSKAWDSLWSLDLNLESGKGKK
ncbi:autophagy-related protein 11, partial [Lecanoromycetidae sp. Uapishka_2]